jgi:hypothetical protein
MQSDLESQIKLYNEKSSQHAQNWKKINALVNFSKTIDDFKEWEALEFIVRYFFRNYLDQEQEAFLDYVLAKYEIEYDKWCYKTYWVKKQFRGVMQKKKDQQLKFMFPDLEQKQLEARSKMPLFSKLENHKLFQPQAVWKS